MLNNGPSHSRKRKAEFLDTAEKRQLITCAYDSARFCSQIEDAISILEYDIARTLLTNALFQQVQISPQQINGLILCSKNLTPDVSVLFVDLIEKFDQFQDERYGPRRNNRMAI